MCTCFFANRSGNVASMFAVALVPLMALTGAVTDYAYDDLGRLDTLTAPGNRVWVFDYDLGGDLTQYTHPNGMTTYYDYDAKG